MAVEHEDVIPELGKHLRPLFASSPNCSTLEAQTDTIPLTYGGHTVAYHFVRQVGA